MVEIKKKMRFYVNNMGFKLLYIQKLTTVISIKTEHLICFSLFN